MAIHCCERMEQAATFNCELHESEFDCPDVLITYNEIFDEYGLIVHDGGSSSIGISFCPFCGRKLPESKRDEWFDRLEKLGIDPGVEETLPQEFTTAEWRENT